jgi:hypothetical protein
MSFDDMALREELPFLLKRAIVQRLACYETPTEVAKAIKAEFDIELSLQRIQYYDPNTKAGQALAPDLKALFAETRKAFLDDLDSIPIANKAVRLRHLQKLIDFFAPKNAAGIMLEVMEAAAKEVGNAFTNERKHKLSGPNGEPLPAGSSTVIILPDNGRGDIGRSSTPPAEPAAAAAGDGSPGTAAGTANSVPLDKR